MIITDIVINEASAAEKARQRKLIAQQQRLANLQSEKQKQLLSQQAAVKRLEKRITKFDPATSVSSAEQPTELVGKSAANDIDPRYIYNPEYDELDSTKDIGVYLKFHRDDKNSDVIAYYSKQPYISYAGAVQYVPPPLIVMGKRFSGVTFQKILKRLVEKTSTSTRAGYVSIAISDHNLKVNNGNRFFTEMLAWLQTYYSQNTDEMSATVYWEIIKT